LCVVCAHGARLLSRILRAAAGSRGQPPSIAYSATRRHTACMFYFFRRNGRSIRCEVRADSAGDGYELIVDRPNATLTVEHFGAPPELNRRWREIERTLVREGWQGPHAKGN
jgi:hypothetical protein